MKKICLLAIGSFFSALAFSQNAATVQTVPGQPKPGRSAAAQTTTTTPAITTATGAGKTTTRVKNVQPAKSKILAVKPATAPAVAADKAANKTGN